MIKRFKAVPWLLVFAAVQVIWDHWHRMEERDRARVAEIFRESKGMPHRMSREARREIVDIAKRIDHVSLGRDMANVAAPFPVPGLKSKKPGGKSK